MTETSIMEVSDIIEQFNLQEISELLQKQIQTDHSDTLANNPNIFKPLYINYRTIMENNNLPDEIRDEAHQRFYTICAILIELICKKFGLEIDDVWKDDHVQDLPALALSLYSFFVIDFVSNINEVLNSFITNRLSDIYNTFEHCKQKKDAMTMMNKKNMKPEIAILVSNIYDITSWILHQMSESQYMYYMNPDYVPLGFLRKMFEEGYISGEFMDMIREIYESNITLKGEICFNIISKYNTYTTKS